MPTPSTDPAWFYSSLAQVSAVIVGLIGAILGTRLINHIAEVQLARKGIEAKLLYVQEMLADRASRIQRFYELVQDVPTAGRAALAYELFRGDALEDHIRQRAAALRGVLYEIPAGTGGQKQAREELGHEVNVLEDTANELRMFRLRLVPRPFIAMLLVMGFLTAAGIVWPLWALLEPPAPDRQNMLSLFSLGMIVLVVYFGYELLSLRKLGTISWPKRK